jgi:hypothetical protein
MLQRSSRLRCALVLDGDQRDQRLAARDTPVLFLPGAYSPEQELFEAARRRPGKVAERLGRSPDAMEVLDDTLRFAEHQAWWRLLSARLGVEKSALLDGVVQVWLDEPDNCSRARDLVASLARYISP